MKILFIAYDGILTQSVFSSQIRKQVELLSNDNDKKIYLIAFESLTVYFRELKKILILKREMEKSANICCYFLPRVPTALGLKFAAFLIPILVSAKRILSNDDFAILLCRGCKGATIGIGVKSIFKKVKLIFDVRDLEPEQYVSAYQTSSGIDFSRMPKKLIKLYNQLSRLESDAIKCSDFIFCQSSKLQSSITNKYKIPPEKIAVYPNAVDTNVFNVNLEKRNCIRQKLGIDTKFVVVYAGTIHAYQLPTESIVFFKEVLNQIPNAYLLALTPTPDKLIDLLSAGGVSENNYSVLSAPHHEVAHYLNAGDCGILFRVQNEYSKNSAPVKFAEYLGTGIYTITLEGIGDISDFIKSHEAGIVLNDTSISSLKQGAKKLAHICEQVINPEYKVNLSKLAESFFSQNNQIKDKACLFKKLCRI